MTLRLAVPLWLVTLAVGGTAVLSADFGVSAWVFLLLFAWLLTIGLPTTLGVVAVASVWSGGGLGAFFATAAGVSLLFQVGVMHEIRRLWRYWRGTKNPESTE